MILKIYNYINKGFFKCFSVYFNEILYFIRRQFSELGIINGFIFDKFQYNFKFLVYQYRNIMRIHILKGLNGFLQFHIFMIKNIKNSHYLK